MEINSASARMLSKLGLRGSFAVTLLEQAGLDERLIVMTADLTTLTGLERFKNTYPDRLINIGIAEQNMVGIGAGIAKEGYNVFITTYSNFLAMRSYEQIRMHLGYMKLNVKVVGTGSGLAMGMSGNSHYGIEDVALMRAIPGLTVLSPSDGVETVKATIAASKFNGPVYIRLTGGLNSNMVYREDYDFEIGKAVTLKEGKDVTIIATGPMVYESLLAAKILEERGISVAVINMHTIKPLDSSVLDIACKKSKLIVTVEEHTVVGGLGGAVAEYKATLSNSPRQLFIGLPDKFGKVGEYKYLLDKYGLTAERIANKIIENVNG